MYQCLAVPGLPRGSVCRGNAVISASSRQVAVSARLPAKRVCSLWSHITLQHIWFTKLGGSLNSSSCLSYLRILSSEHLRLTRRSLGEERLRQSTSGQSTIIDRRASIFEMLFIDCSTICCSAIAKTLPPNPLQSPKLHL